MAQHRLYKATGALRFHSKGFSVIYARENLYVKDDLLRHIRSVQGEK